MTQKIVKRVILSQENLARLRQHYPKGSLSWTLDMLLKHFRRVHTMLPEDFAEIGAKELKRMLEK